MAKTTTYQIRLDEETKNASFEVFREFWITPANGIRMYLRQVLSTRSIPLSLERPNAETRKSMEDSDKGIGLYRAKDANDLFKHLGI